jgi:hypothetical protein
MFFAHIYTRQQVSSAVLVFQLGTMDHALVLCLHHVDGYFAPLHHAASAAGEPGVSTRVDVPVALDSRRAIYLLSAGNYTPTSSFATSVCIARRMRACHLIAATPSCDRRRASTSYQ